MKTGIPEEIRRLIGQKEFEMDSIGMSQSEIMIFEDMVLKVQTATEESENEIRMMKWLQGKLPVPRIISCKRQDETEYLLMSKLKGRMSCDMEYLSDPDKLCRLLAESLKKLWEIDITDCPYSNTLEKKLATAEYQVKHDLVDLDNVDPATFGEGGFLNPEELLEWLKQNRPEEDLVFSHGDFCLPNIFIMESDAPGYLDLGRSGIADRWQDIALCFRSLKDNLAGAYQDHEPIPYDADKLFYYLEVAPDWEKIRYFTLLDELF